MATSYPGGLDSFTNPTGTDDLADEVGGRTHSEMHADVNDAMEAVQAELGTNPSAGFATVAARFTDVEADVTALATDLTALEGVVDGLPGADARVFDVVTYGAVVNGSTDDTAAWQAAINAAAAAGGGVVTSSLNGVSVIGGALQDTGGANAQLILPAVDYADAEAVSIVIRGLTPPSSVFSVIGASPAPDNHLVLKSTLASGTGAVIGAQGPSGTFGNFTNVHLTMTDLTVRTVTNPTLTGLDLRRLASVDLDRLVVDTGSYDIVGLAQPSTSTSYGIRLPGNNNGAHVRLGMVDVAGFYTGYEFAEHATGQKVAAWGCRVAAEFDSTNHASVFLRFMAVHCTVGWKFTGAHAVDCWQYDVEHANSSQGWRQTTYDLDDASNLGKGFLRWHAVLAGTGDHNSFTKNGGTGFTTSRVGDAIGSGGGTTTYVHRDRLTAASTDDTLTLGATPVAGSPLVWVDDVIAWPGVDYSITGAAITFLSAFVGGEVVSVQYHSTTSTYTAASLSGTSVSITDSFTRADSTSSLGTTETGSKAWTANIGTWGINTNRAYVSTGVAGQVNYATIDAGVADCTVSVKPVAGGGVYGGIAFRVASTGNGYILEFNVGSSYGPKIYKIVSGSATAIATGAAVTIAIGDVITVELAGDSIVAKRNGTAIVSVTDSTYQTATKHGIYIVATTTSALRLDDFSVTS